MTDVTQILHKLEQGDPDAAEQLLPIVYAELRRLAAVRMARENPGQTLQATALVHEAYLRLVKSEAQQWDSRGHFFSAAAEAMRRILVDRARKQAVRKRHGVGNRVDLDEICDLQAANPDLLHLDEALDKLQLQDPQAAELVKLRFFAGLGHEETAEVLGVTRRVADRIWKVARAWLSREIRRG